MSAPVSQPLLPAMSLRKSAQVLTWSDAEVAAFIQRIVTEGEFALSENSHKLRTYSNSFAGLDFVSFLNAKRLANSRAAAVTLGRDWLARGFIQHVTLDQQFQDAHHIYRFHNYGRPEAIDDDFVAIESKSSAPPPSASSASSTSSAPSARARLVPPASASNALPPSGPLPTPTSFEVNQLGVLVADSLASVSLYNQLTPDSQLLSDCNCSPEHSGSALLAMPVVGRSTYVLPRSKLSDGTRNVEIEHLDVLVGDDINDDEDLHGEDEDASNSDVYVDDDDDDDGDGGGGGMGGVGAGINSSEGFSLANSVKEFAANSKQARAKNVRAAADDDDDDTGPTRKYEPPKSALIALINSVSDTVARNDSFDNRVGELRENDITYLSKFQEDSPVASKILLSSRKLPPAKPTAGGPTATGAMRLRLPYSEQAPPNAGLLREAPAHYQAIPEAKRPPPPLPAKLQRRDFAEFEATALRELFARSAVPSAAWRRCAPTTIVVLCPTCCEPMAVRPRPRVSSRALPFSAKTLECGGCKGQIMPPLLPPPSCDECRLRRPATRVCIPDLDVSVMWLCRRCCARVERLLSAVVEDLPTLADNSVGTFSGSGAQHAVFRAETVTEILLTRAIDPPGWHRKMISRPSMRQDANRTSNSAKK
jgi:hypothetical protein